MDKFFEQDLAEILHRTQNIKRELGSRVADAYLIGGEELDSCKKSLEYLLGIQQNTFLLARQVGFGYTQEGRMATLSLQGTDFTIAFERAVEAPKEKEPAPMKEEAI